MFLGKSVFGVCLLVLGYLVLLMPMDIDAKKVQKKQLSQELESRETNPPNFVRLLMMRLVYGVAAQMGLEERLSGVLNGAFVPPNADDDDYDGGILDDIGAGDLGGDLLDY